MKIKPIVIDGVEQSYGYMLVKDPCYDIDNSINQENMADGKIKVKAGNWSVWYESGYIYASTDGDIGVNSNLMHVPVDSGQISLSCGSVHPNGDTGEYGDLNSFYGQACDNSDSGGNEFLDGYAFCVSTDYGDGTYEAYLSKNKNDEVVGISIPVGDTAEDEDDDEYTCISCGMNDDGCLAYGCDYVVN